MTKSGAGSLFLATMALGTALITATSLVYFQFDTVAPFVIERLPERFASLWLVSLRVHVAAAIVSLPLCLALTTRALRKRPAWHRGLGRFTGVLVLLALVPTGTILAFHAKGGAVVTAGFLLSAALVAWFIVRGVLAARRGDLVSHRHAMRHVVGQMSVAVTSRALVLGLNAIGIDPDVAYVVALWGPVLASAAVVELISELPFASRRVVRQLLATILRSVPHRFLLCAIVASIAPSLASADEPSLTEWTQARVADGIVRPLTELDRIAFSRLRPPASERRIRVLRSTALLDDAGHAFVPFAIDSRFGANWHQDDLVGCAYPAGGMLYIKRGEGYRPAAFLFGKNLDPVAGACQSDPARRPVVRAGSLAALRGLLAAAGDVRSVRSSIAWAFVAVLAHLWL